MEKLKWRNCLRWNFEKKQLRQQRLTAKPSKGVAILGPPHVLRRHSRFTVIRMTLLAIAGRGPFGITLNHLFALPAPRSDPEMTHAILCCCGKPFAYINQPYGGEPVASTRRISIDSNLRNEPSARLWLALTISGPLRGVMISQWRTLCVSSLWYAKLVSLFSWEKLVCNCYKNKNISRLNILCTNIFFPVWYLELWWGFYCDETWFVKRLDFGLHKLWLFDINIKVALEKFFL